MGNKIFYEGMIEKAGSGAPEMVQTVNDRKYTNTFLSVIKSQWVESNCAEIAFLNVGDGNFPTPAGADINILGFIIKPGFGISFDGDENEIDVTKYNLVFVGAGVKHCWVFRKLYT